MELQNIGTTTTWNEAASRINSNNQKISTELMKLGSATYKNKGYFKTLSDLQSAFPTATVGSKAYVGLSYPYAIYLWENNSWVDSGATGGDDSALQNAVDLNTEQTIIATKTFRGGINLNGTTISKVGSPVNTDDAANKSYVDGAVSKIAVETESLQEVTNNNKAAIDNLTSIPFTNPVGEWCPDPCFWKGDDGYFYIKGTGRLATVKRTRDFVNYEDTDRIFISTEAQNKLFDLYGHYATDDSTYKLHPNYWAPFVIKIGDNWVLYQAIIERTGTKTNAVDGTAHIVAFTSKTPYGNFSNPVTIVSDNEITAAYNSSTKWNNIIDPFVYCDPFDNHIYLLAGSSYAIRRKRLSDDGLSMYKDGSTLSVDNYAMHAAGQSIGTDPSRATVYEGAYLYNKIGKWGNYWYLFVSSGSYDSRDYCVKVGRFLNANYHIGGTTNINFLDKKNNNMRVGGGTKILSTESDTSPFWGPGHIGGIFETEDGKTWMLYHCHDGNGTQDRKLFIQELLWDEDGWPYFENNGHPISNGRISRHIITSTNDVKGNKAEEVTALHQRLNDLEYKHDMDKEDIQGQVSDLGALARGAQRALVYADYSKLVTALNAGMVGTDVLPKGQSIYIQQLDVPDLWVSNFRAPDDLTEYTYTNDADFLEYIKGGGWIGCHQLSLLETAKVDLSNTASKTEVTALQAEVAALKAIINEITTKE